MTLDLKDKELESRAHKASSLGGRQGCQGFEGPQRVCTCMVVFEVRGTILGLIAKLHPSCFTSVVFVSRMILYMESDIVGGAEVSEWK